MKIIIGSMFQIDGPSLTALEIPGLGFLKSKIDDENPLFYCVELDRKQLKKLKKEIDKELSS